MKHSGRLKEVILDQILYPPFPRQIDNFETKIKITDELDVIHTQIISVSFAPKYMSRYTIDDLRLHDLSHKYETRNETDSNRTREKTFKTNVN